MKRGILVIIILVILISGCSSIPQLPSLPSFQKEISDSKGLSIKFRENQPPLDEIISGKNFKVTLDIINYDPEDISGTISLSDTPSDEFSSLKGKEQQSFSLPAAELIGSRLAPSKESLTFGPYVYSTENAFKGMTTTFITELTTQRKTSISTQICIKSDTSENVKCSNKETITNLGSQAQYSPVTVTKIEKVVVPEDEGILSLSLKIYLKNVGKGKIDNEDQSLNSFTLNFPGSSNLDCTKKDKIILKDNEALIFCTAEIVLADELFRQDLIQISFDYPYKIIETLGPIKITKLE